MSLQPETEIPEKELINLCRRLSGPNRSSLKAAVAKHTLNHAIALKLVSNQEDGPRLTKHGKQWLKKALSNGGLETQPVPVQVGRADSPLAWLKSRKDKAGSAYITELQYEAGERLREDFTYAQYWGTVKSNWRSERAPKSACKIDDVSDSVYDARERVQKALTAVGPELSGILMDVCCFLKALKHVESERQWPQRTAKVVLGLALDRLSKHYGSSRQRAVGPETSQMVSWTALSSEQAQQTHHP
ncbi:DUF6456 domain-containing protein [Pseudovibrio brasiliensis]|uniref:DUF6456 domain-containing protein n=1 Tax=Pseudovibrio brasiliensis TaxID=1898042 RepID=A0ABX8ASL2_9HYPH|nr:DUF6456 domain-containing protein [Pseudovibrio brasiliensis]QUS57227.1 hypothetical protein KGB56_07510 [Pseudovibrio brasiliensis]